MIRKAADADIGVDVPTITRDGFNYDGQGFFVHYEDHRVERCESNTLYQLLTHVQPPPLMTKAGAPAKRQPAPFQDQPGWYYCAQLSHYGLKPLKTKDAAKKSLLTAFHTNPLRKLEVPNKILKVEADIKAEYDALATKLAGNGKAAKKAKKEAAPQAAAAAPKPRAAAKKAAAQVPATTVPAAAVVHPKPPAPARPKQASPKKAQPNATPAPAAPPEPKTESPPRTAPRTKQTARRTGAAALLNPNRPSPRQLIKNLLALPQAEYTRILVKLVDTSPNAEGILNEFLDASVAKAQKKAERERKKEERQLKALEGGFATTEFLGRFTCSVPKVLEQWGSTYEGPYNMVLATSQSGHLWAKFNFGLYTGILRSNGAVPKSLARMPVAFSWHGRETGEGQISVGENGGTLTFQNAGLSSFKGIIHTQLGKFDFSGTAKPGPALDAAQEVRDWKYSYRRMNRDAWDKECSGRWGSWSEDPEPDRPEESDTDAGGNGSCSDNSDDDAMDWEPDHSW